MNLSLRAKGLIAFVAFALYIGLVGAVLSSERYRMLEIAGELETLHERGAAMLKASHAINHSMLRVQGLLHAATLGPTFGDDLALDVELIQSSLQALQKFFPEFDDEMSRLSDYIADLRDAPSRSGLLALAEEERVLDRRITEIEGTLRASRTALWEQYYRVNDRITMLALTMNLVGVIVFGALITLFFTRLAWDIRKVGERAEQVANGYRGEPLEITRTDEIGGLLGAVNRMQHELRHREQKLEVDRAQRFHRERMAAVGSVAAAVAHEINNPIAAIAGIAQTMTHADSPRHAVDGGRIAASARLILEQTQRISGISRQVAELTRPRAPTPELLDLNELVRNTCKFIRYDKRLRGIEMPLELDPGLPAVRAVADHVTQVLMNLVINAADALEGVKDRPPAIRVGTRIDRDAVLLSVADNGHGMDADTLARAFEESFSTKPSDKGRGLGLYLCRDLVGQGGGSIVLASEPGKGTVATVRLPLPEPKRT